MNSIKAHGELPHESHSGQHPSENGEQNEHPFTKNKLKAMGGSPNMFSLQDVETKIYVEKKYLIAML